MQNILTTAPLIPVSVQQMSETDVAVLQQRLKTVGRFVKIFIPFVQLLAVIIIASVFTSIGVSIQITVMTVAIFVLSFIYVAYVQNKELKALKIDLLEKQKNIFEFTVKELKENNISKIYQVIFENGRSEVVDKKIFDQLKVGQTITREYAKHSGLLFTQRF